MKKPFALLCAFATTACFALVGCASDDAAPAPADAAETGPEDDLTSSANKSCGAAYTPALRKYELAVQASKKLLAGGNCDEITHDKDASLSTTVTKEDIADLTLASIAECAAFRDVYTKSPYAAPLRKALTDSLLAKVIDGSLSTDTFRGLGDALPGTRMYGPKPGVALLFTVDFKADGKATFHRYDWELEKDVDTEATYEISEGDKPAISITLEGKTTVYTPRFDADSGYNNIVFSAEGDDAPISTSSNPCSA